MSRTPLARIAYVQFSPQGKSYPLACEREDIGPGDEVDVCMFVGTPKAFNMDGVVTSIAYERWECRSRVEYLTREVSYTLDENFVFTRTINVAPSTATPDGRVVPLDRLRAERRKRYAGTLPKAHRTEMQDIYDAVAGEEGCDAYLGDGVWISPDGSLDDRGR